MAITGLHFIVERAFISQNLEQDCLKGESQNVCFKKRTPNFPKNEHFLPPDTHTCTCACTCAYQGVRNIRF